MSSSWTTSTFGDPFRKPKLPRNVPKHSTKTSDCWVEIVAPQKKEDLAVHKKKVEELEQWVKLSSKRGVILLLTGPPGCGKTAAVRAVCSSLSVNVEEFSSTIQQQFKKGDDVEIESQFKAFSNFLLRRSRYASLSNCSANDLILLEDIPNVFLYDPSLFHDLLRKYQLKGRCPLVIILSDENQSIIQKLLPKHVQNELLVTSLSFNPIAATAMMKALVRTCEIVAVKVAKEELENLVSSHSGDIRSTINTLQFGYTPQKPGKKRKMSTFNSRDQNLFLFHALGKVLYAKRQKDGSTDDLPPHLSKMARPPLLEDPDNIIEKCAISSESLALFLHQNYLPFADSIEDAFECVSGFSAADSLTNLWEKRDILEPYASLLSVRNMMFHINSGEEKQSRGWRPLNKPQWYGISKDARLLAADSRSAFQSRFYGVNDSQLFTELIPYFSSFPVTTTSHEEAVLFKLRFSKRRCQNQELLNEKEVFEESVVEEVNAKNGPKMDPVTVLQDDDDQVVIEEFSD